MSDKGFEKYVRSRFAMAEIESSQYMTFAEAERVFITLMEQVRADAWDEGAEFAWQRTGEGHNSEYVEHYGTHDGELRFAHANGDHNPYRENK